MTVLVRPGPPVITPRTPVATEGEAMNISCSSEGGSPAPDIFWYMEVRKRETERVGTITTLFMFRVTAILCVEL